MLGQASGDKQVADSFLNMALAMLVAIGLVYLIMVVLFRSLLVPVVILCPLPPAVIGAFVALAVTGHALDLSALIGLLMLRGIVVTNAIVLLDLVQYKIEAGADGRTTMIQDEAHAGAPRPDEAAATIIALIPLALSSVANASALAEAWRKDCAFLLRNPQRKKTMRRRTRAEGEGREKAVFFLAQFERERRLRGCLLYSADSDL